MTPFARFILAALLVCACGYGALHLYARTPAFCAHSSDYASTAPCYQFDTAGVRADVLLVGDSALLYGIRPATVRAASGLSAYNFGLVGPAFAFDPVAVIDRWLARNPRPRMIVVYVSPWDLIEPGRITDPQWAPLAVLVAQHGGPGAFARMVAAQPSILAEVPPLVVSTFSLDVGTAARNRTALVQDGGHVDFEAAIGHPVPRLDTDCRPPTQSDAPAVSDRMRGAIAALRSRYRAKGIPLYLYVAPTAPCDRALGAIRAAFAGLADNVPSTLSDGLFAADGARRHVHLGRDGAEAASRLLAGFVAARARGDARP